MHYILHLFRAYADEPSLLSSPFAAEQVTRFRSGIVPDGELLDAKVPTASDRPR